MHRIQPGRWSGRILRRRSGCLLNGLGLSLLGLSSIPVEHTGTTIRIVWLATRLNGLLVWQLPVWHLLVIGLLIVGLRRLLIGRPLKNRPLAGLPAGLLSLLVGLVALIARLITLIWLIALLIERAAIPLVKRRIDGLGHGPVYGLTSTLVCRRVRRLRGRLVAGRVPWPVEARVRSLSRLPGWGIVPSIVTIVAVIPVVAVIAVISVVAIVVPVIPVIVITIVVIPVTVPIVHRGIHRPCVVKGLDPCRGKTRTASISGAIRGLIGIDPGTVDRQASVTRLFARCTPFLQLDRTERTAGIAACFIGIGTTGIIPVTVIASIPAIIVDHGGIIDHRCVIDDGDIPRFVHIIVSDLRAGDILMGNKTPVMRGRVISSAKGSADTDIGA